MPICSCCQTEREASGHDPRELQSLPEEVLTRPDGQGNLMFKNTELPVLLCPHCDGDALMRAVNTALKGGRTG